MRQTNPMAYHRRPFHGPTSRGERAGGLVEIEPEAVDSIERAAHRRLPVGSPFWTALAERLLNSALWNDGKVPAGGKLTVDSGRIDHEAVQLAVGWDPRGLNRDTLAIASRQEIAVTDPPRLGTPPANSSAPCCSLSAFRPKRQDGPSASHSCGRHHRPDFPRTCLAEWRDLRLAVSGLGANPHHAPRSGRTVSRGTEGRWSGVQSGGAAVSLRGDRER